MAEKNRRRFGVSAPDLVLADGLPDGSLADDCVVIAGLGGVEIKHLKASYLPNALFYRLTHAEILREALASLGLSIIDEHVVLGTKSIL